METQGDFFSVSEPEVMDCLTDYVQGRYVYVNMYPNSSYVVLFGDRSRVELQQVCEHLNTCAEETEIAFFVDDVPFDLSDLAQRVRKIEDIRRQMFIWNAETVFLSDLSELMDNGFSDVEMLWGQTTRAILSRNKTIILSHVNDLLDIFAENGIALPKTFDEYIAVCKQFQDLGIKPLSAGLKSWEPMLKNSMAFVTAEYLSTDAGKNFGAEYREGTTTLDGVWNSYIEKWSEMITAGVYTTDMTGIDHTQALEEFATGGSAMFCSGPWDLEAIQSKNPDLDLGMFPFNGTAESAGWLIGGPGCGFAANASSANLEATIKVLTALSTAEGQEALWAGNAGGSSYLLGVEFELPAVYDDIATAIAAGNVYCPWNEWGDAAAAHQDYGVEMQNYLLGQDLASTLQNVDAVVADLISK